MRRPPAQKKLVMNGLIDVPLPQNENKRLNEYQSNHDGLSEENVNDAKQGKEEKDQAGEDR